MIVRIWHGRTERRRADEYARFLAARAVPDYRSVPGNLEVVLLRRDEGETTHFLTVTRWRSEEAIRAFAGAQLLRAKYYPEDAGFLLELEPEVRHYEVVARAEAPGGA
jgi:heme-degrading monooxygenase HmoA